MGINDAAMHTIVRDYTSEAGAARLLAVLQAYFEGQQLDYLEGTAAQMAFEEVATLLAKARFVVEHAGAGQGARPWRGLGSTGEWWSRGLGEWGDRHGG